MVSTVTSYISHPNKNIQTSTQCAIYIYSNFSAVGDKVIDSTVLNFTQKNGDTILISKVTLISVKIQAWKTTILRKMVLSK